MSTAPPALVPRPFLARWLFERNMTLRDGAVYFDTTPETLRRAILPFGDAGMRPPRADLMRRVIERTAGQVRADHWYAPVVESAA